ncbi:MAG TPA: 4-hydroxyphenylacetate 3-hydroxylase N-terminal domain-containing protein, partial [Devosia sp.]|nr:4-hydroxyphenylacetate 3-hydroxylase N-terminal domain-containing protein [Devosia sp.]
YADECLVDDPERPGEKMSASLIVPRSKEDLMVRHRGLERLARYSNGLLGRTPDYVNVVLAGHVARKDIWMREGHDPVYYERLVRFHREVIEGDLAMTHTIIHAAIDKSIGELEGMNKDLTLRVVDRTETGVIVRGGKVLGTLAPFADEIYVYPSSPIAPGNEEHALCFSIPMSTKGLVVVCRDHYGLQMDLADAPFSARFDEQDAYVIFNDVEVPYERLFVDGNLDVYNAISPAVSPGNTLQQTAIRAMVKLEFAYDLCVEIAKVTNSTKRPDVAAMLGEIYTYFSLTRSAIVAAEAKAHPWGDAGAFFCDGDIASLRCVMPVWMVRVNEIIKALGSHNLLATPSLAAFDNPALGPLLEKYLPGSNGMPARDRARIMRTAWDFAGSALGTRLELYEMFYLGSAGRGRMVDHMVAQANGQGNQVRGFLKESGAWLE